MAIEIKNELRAAAIVDGADGGDALQLFGFAGFIRTGLGVYQFPMLEAADPGQHSIYCTTGINELAIVRGRLISPGVLEVRSYLPSGAPVDCVVLFVELHRYPGEAGVVLPTAPAPLAQGSGGTGAVIAFGNNGIGTNTDTKFLCPWFDDAGAPQARVPWRAPRAGLVANMSVRQNSVGIGGDIVYALEVNTVATAISITMAASDLQGVDDVNTVAVAMGDLLSVVVTKAVAITDSPNDIIVSANFF